MVSWSRDRPSAGVTWGTNNGVSPGFARDSGRVADVGSGRRRRPRGRSPLACDLGVPAAPSIAGDPGGVAGARSPVAAW